MSKKNVCINCYTIGYELFFQWLETENLYLVVYFMNEKVLI